MPGRQSRAAPISACVSPLRPYRLAAYPPAALAEYERQQALARLVARLTSDNCGQGRPIHRPNVHGGMYAFT